MIVYILRNNEGLIYKGITNNLARRLELHNDRRRKAWTSKRGPWILVYEENVFDEYEVRKREVFFKSGKGREYLKKIIGE